MFAEEDYYLSQLFEDLTELPYTKLHYNNIVITNIISIMAGAFDIPADVFDDSAEAIIASTPKVGVMCDAEVEASWLLLFNGLGLAEDVARQRAMIAIVWYGCINSSSTQNDFMDKIVIGEREITMAEVLNKMGLQSSNWRRFIRSRFVIDRVVMGILRTPRYINILKKKADALGLDTKMYRVVLDFADHLPLTAAERAAFADLSQRKLKPERTRHAIRAGDRRDVNASVVGSAQVEHGGAGSSANLWG